MTVGSPVPLPHARLGKYEVIARLGKGGMAHVHLAVARGLGGFNKLVVLKRLDSSDQAFRDMFMDEARLAARLQHANVVHTYEVSETEGSYFMAMEYLDGQSLDKLIRETKKLALALPARLCARIVADALGGLHYTHELCDYDGLPLNVVHRDVSPHNIFVTYEGTVKLLDFGVAKTSLASSETQSGVLKGKLAYMAPEQAAAQPVDRRADVFSMGVVLWELLTLRRLRTADSPAGVLSEAIHGQLPDLSQLRPDVSRELEGILWQALVQYPQRRFQTAQTMRDALIRYLAREPFSQEELGVFMQQRFRGLRQNMQQAISRCLNRAELLHPAIRVVSDQDALVSVDPSERSLPLLESGSSATGLRNEDATTPLAPILAPPSSPAARLDGGSPARSRSITFADESSGPPSDVPRWLAFGGVAAVATVGAFALFATRPPDTQPLRIGASRPAASTEPEDVVLRLHGSNTIGQELAPRLAQAFLQAKGYLAVERSPETERTTVSGRDPRDGQTRSIEIVAQGSATAFTDLARGACDIGMSSRRIKPEEVAQLRARGAGDLESAAGEHVLGLDGIAVIVHPNSPLERLDLVSLRHVFTGEIDDYAALGGTRGPIHLYSRDDRSGTFDTFKHLVLGTASVPSTAQRFVESGELSSAVARDPQGLGFIGIPYVRGARALAIGTVGGAYLYPSSFTVATEGYELSRRLYLYLPVQRVKPLAVELVSFALSGQGQQVVKESGFVDLTLRATATAPCEHCPPSYRELARGGKRLSLDFRFRTASAELDNRGVRDLDRILTFLRENGQARLVLVGFSDSRGAAPQNSRLSLDRAKKVAALLRERGVGAIGVEAMGSALPVAANDSEHGREKNRRVEVWVR